MKNHTNLKIGEKKLKHITELQRNINEKGNNLN